MKKINLIINGVLFLAVAGIYVLFFLNTKGENNNSDNISSSIPVSGVSVAYVNIDTLITNLDKYFDLNNELMAKQKQSQIKLENNAKAIEKNYIDMQEKVEKGLVTRSTAQQMELQLQQEQDRYLKLRDDLSMQLAEEGQVMNRVIMNDIISYLQKYNKGKNYQFIINNSYGGTLLYANDSMNITKDIITGLNEAYSKEKENK